MFKKILEKLNANKKVSAAEETYSLTEAKKIEQHITQNFGKISNVLHELVSLDIHLDIYIIDPNEKHDYYTLVTVGVGAHKMNVPEQLSSYKLDRCELVMTLPKSWNLNSRDKIWFWPIILLKTLGRLPIDSNTWLGFGHTISNQGYFAENTKLSGSLITNPYSFGVDSSICELNNSKVIRFYQIVPIYEEEMEYKLKNGMEALENLYPEEFRLVLDIERKSFLEK